MEIKLHDKEVHHLDENAALDVLRHSTAHLMAHAIETIYPQAKLVIGPNTSEGFYYDIDFQGVTLTEADLEKIEAKMKEISKEGKSFFRKEVTKEEAQIIFKDNPYKLELIEKATGPISIFIEGNFTDLCRGPHLSDTGKIKHFKLLNLAGAYLHGNSKEKMLTRIYGTSFFTKEALDAYLKLLEERKERDHRRLGKELRIFTFDPLIGPGLPIWLPRGATVKRLLERYIQDKEIALGYEHVYTPVLASTELYRISGHLAHYKDSMFPVMKMENEELVLRPMNCPHHMLVYKNSLHSYRDLPVRLGELAQDFRYEASGALLGLERVRSMCMNDAHIFARPDQIESEFKNVVQLILEVYQDLKIVNYSFRLSLRDPADKEKYYDDDQMWKKAETKLRNVLTKLKLPFEEAKGEAAFYGPKLDVQIKTALGHEITLSTCQLDFLLPEKFDLFYIDKEGKKVRPVVLHRAITSTSERFIAYLLEELKGNFPVWMTPVQATILPVNPTFQGKYARMIHRKLDQAGFRVTVDDSDEKLGYRLRKVQLDKVPYTIVVGDEELKSKTIMVRAYQSSDQIKMTLKDFIKKLSVR
ncbi:MAG: threonine--tRNA ligase [Erysipelotrichaceae bacterium]|jgi:threonyl-tRNA synthetase|nr:threonine--tRNA ligase [Erysipelotrichaceae bacterium]